MRIKIILITSILLLNSAVHPAFSAEPRDSNLLWRIFADAGEKIKAAFQSLPELKDSFIRSLGRDNPKTKFEIAQETYYMKYEEPDIMENVGMMYGLNMAFSYRVENPVFFKSVWENIGQGKTNTKFLLEARWARGKVDYDSNSTGSDDGITDMATELRGIVCYEIMFSERTSLTPYGGIGFRYLSDDSRGRYTTTGNWGYLRESKYFYIPFGMELNHGFSERWTLKLKGEYDLLLEGKQKSHLEDGGPWLQDSTSGQYYTVDTVENAQEVGVGIRGSLRLQRQSERFDFFLEPYARYWHIKESDHVQLTSEGGSILWYVGSTDTPLTGYEPDNNTLEYGLVLGLNF